MTEYKKLLHHSSPIKLLASIWNTMASLLFAIEMHPCGQEQKNWARCVENRQRVQSSGENGQNSFGGNPSA